MRKRSTLSFQGFTNYLMDRDNDVIDKGGGDDMSHPLSHYYIASSHNTYLTGHQEWKSYGMMQLKCPKQMLKFLKIKLQHHYRKKYDHASIDTVFPRRLGPFHIIGYCIKKVMAYWTDTIWLFYVMPKKPFLTSQQLGR